MKQNKETKTKTDKAGSISKPSTMLTLKEMHRPTKDSKAQK